MSRDTSELRTYDLPFLPFHLSGLKVPDHAFGELGNVRGEAGRGEVETENYAHRGVPYPQSRIPAQNEYRYCQDQRDGNRYRQMITSFQLLVLLLRGVSLPGTRGAPCGATTGRENCISRTAARRQWLARRTRTGFRSGTRRFGFAWPVTSLSFGTFDSTGNPLRFQCGSSAEAVRFQAGTGPVLGRFRSG